MQPTHDKLKAAVSLPSPTRAEALTAVRTLIAYIGDDPQREGLLDTPERVLKAWGKDWGRGYQEIAPADLIRTFEGQHNPAYLHPAPRRYDQMVVVKNIDIFSCCEHHMAPFFGRAHIAYVPGSKGLVGLSKLARVADHFSRRLQVQERLTEQVAGFLAEHLSPHIAVMLACTHLCMVSRGVQQAHSITQTTALRGDFYNDPTTRAEFLRACPVA
jgi:GTP cyclohydrolase I